MCCIFEMNNTEKQEELRLCLEIHLFRRRTNFPMMEE